MRHIQRTTGRPWIWFIAALVGLLTVTGPASARTLPDTKVAARVIDAESHGARHIGAKCRRHGHRTICDVAWFTHRRAYTGRVAILARATATATVYRYRLRATCWRLRYRTHMHRHGRIVVPIPAGSTRTNPIALGSPATVGNWTLTVTAATMDATAEVLAANPYNDPPAPGYQYALIHVVATYNGPRDSSKLAYAHEFHAVGATAVGYDTDVSVAGELDRFRDVFAGGTIEGDIGSEIDSRDAGSLVLYDVGDGLLDANVYFALR